MTASERNLYDFYDSIGKIPGVTKVTGAHFSMIREGSSGWPSVIYQISDIQELPGIFGKLIHHSESPNAYPFAVINRQLITPEGLESLREIRAFPVEIWDLMEANHPVRSEEFKEKDPSILKIDALNDIEEFTSLVNLHLIGNMKIKADTFYEMSKLEAFDFFCFRQDGKMLTTLLSYSSRDVSGLYFIVTRPEFRGKGYAARLTRHVMNFLFMQGKEKVVLQADRKAVPLYYRTGFTSEGQLAVIKKI